MEKLRNLSLKKTVILYLLAALLASFFLSAVLIQIAVNTQQQITWKYVDEVQYLAQMDGEQAYELPMPRVKAGHMDRADRYVYEICDFIETYSILIFSVFGSGMAVALFYRHKLKPPIEELSQAADMVKQEKLDFHVAYENRDELGQLCKEFENMRSQLEENNRIVWHMIEEEKALRAAIAHDIRSPLAVLKGYQEMLLEFVPEDGLDKEQILSMLEKGMEQIERMNGFVETMRQMSSLEQRPVRAASIPMAELAGKIGNEAHILSRGTGKKCDVQTELKASSFCGDQDMILEVMENLLSNALRYARETVAIKISCKDAELDITVIDDGQGFLESTEKVTQPFYHSNPQDDLKHFGLGMYISKLCCEKHGGKLLLGNQPNGGAFVKALFKEVK